MRLDETTLRAYLDEELLPPEREQIEQLLAVSPEAQTTLAQMRQVKEEVNQVLDRLTPTAETASSALVALKQVQARLEPLGDVTLSTNKLARNASLNVWESPSLLAEFKNDLKKFRYNWKESMTKGLLWATIVTLAIVTSAVAFALWPNLEQRLAEQLQQITPADVVKLSASEEDTPDLPQNVVPTSAMFNREIELVGYKLQQETIAPQKTLELTLYWHSVHEVAKDYTVFIHLADSKGLILAQEDSPPVRGKSPTSHWQPGQVVEDHHRILMPPNFPVGEYDLIVGLYNSNTNERLLVQSESNLIQDSSVLLTQVKIQGEPAQPASTASFGYGIQAAPNGDTEANIRHIKTLGLEWVKFQMPWKEVESTQGNYDWALWDTTLDAYAANGIKVMLTVVKAPDWARPADDDKSVEGPPADPAKYAEFVAQVVDRYQGKVQAVEIWNEQNIWYEAGGKGRINAVDYVRLLQLAYQAVKSANQDVMVIGGALTPAGNIGDLAIDDVEYLKQMYANGVKGYFDALGAHPSGYNCPALADWQTVTPEEASADPASGMFTDRYHSWCFLGTMEAYREVMVANNDGDKAIAPTEFGWAVASNPNEGYKFAADNTPEEQAKWTVEAYQWAKKQGWVGPMFLWNLDYSLVLPDTELAYFSILDTPTYQALIDLTGSSQAQEGITPAAKMAFELKDVRQLTPCENKGRRMLLINVLDSAGQGLNDVPVKIQWSYEALDQIVVRTKTVNNEPGRIEFEMSPETNYSVAVQAAASQVAAGLGTAFAAEEPCTEGGPGNTPGHLSYEIVFQQTDLIPAQPTSTPAVETIFSYGIHADPNGDTAANIGHIQELGFQWVKLSMPWKEVELTQGNYDWVRWDQVIDAYAANGIKVMLTISKAPDWARPTDDDKSVDGLPANPASYASFVAQVAERYRNKVQAVEVWFWPNLWYEIGGHGRMNAATYTQLLQQSYQAIKAANPEMMVISGAMTPAGNVGDMAIDDIDYLRQMYAHGVKDYFDALGANPSGYNCPALADWRTVTPEEAGGDPQHGLFTNRHHSWCFLGTLEGYRQVMIDAGDFIKPVAITEFGWGVSDSPQPGYEYARDNTPVEQAQWIVEAYQWAKEQGWVGPMVLGNLDYNVVEPDNLPLANFGILNTPAYDALVKMPK